MGMSAPVVHNSNYSRLYQSCTNLNDELREGEVNPNVPRQAGRHVQAHHIELGLRAGYTHLRDSSV